MCVHIYDPQATFYLSDFSSSEKEIRVKHTSTLKMVDIKMVCSYLCKLGYFACVKTCFLAEEKHAIFTTVSPAILEELSPFLSSVLSKRIDH